MTTPRPLTPLEIATVDFLLGVVPEADALRAQLAEARAAPGCGCGCATIDLIAPDAPRWGRVLEDPAIALASSRPGSPVHPSEVLLFVHDGHLDSLEFADMGGKHPMAAVPAVDAWLPPEPGPEIVSPTGG